MTVTHRHRRHAHNPTAGHENGGGRHSPSRPQDTTAIAARPGFKVYKYAAKAFAPIVECGQQSEATHEICICSRSVGEYCHHHRHQFPRRHVDPWLGRIWPEGRRSLLGERRVARHPDGFLCLVSDFPTEAQQNPANALLGSLLRISFRPPRNANASLGKLRLECANLAHHVALLGLSDLCPGPRVSAPTCPDGRLLFILWLQPHRQCQRHLPGMRKALQIDGKGRKRRRWRNPSRAAPSPAYSSNPITGTGGTRPGPSSPDPRV